MKKILLGSLIALSTLVAAPVKAEVTPANLIFQGYQGRLNNEGIPGYAPFLQAVYSGKIDAKTLIAGAVSQERLDIKTATSKSYIRQVETALFLLRANGSAR
jgi:hypothetical protein